MAQFRKKALDVTARRINEPRSIATLEGPMDGLPGDWLLTGVAGEQYFVKDEIFRQTYEPVDEAAAHLLAANAADDDEPPGDATDARFDQLITEALILLPDGVRALAAHGVEAARYVHQHRHGYLGGLVNMRIVETAKGIAVLDMEVTPPALNPYGYVHGGMLFTLADNAMGLCCTTLLEQGESPVTLEAKANYIGNIKEGRIRARCEALHKSRHLVMLETRITNAASDDLLMIVTGTFYLIAHDLPQGMTPGSSLASEPAAQPV